MRAPVTTVAAVLAAALLVGMLACGPRLSREEEVELLRSQYTATLASLTVKQEPIEAGTVGKASTGEAPPPRVRTDAVLDIVVSSNAEKPLPGLTIDIEHVDAQRRAKGRGTFWVETATLVQGQSTELQHVLENVAWETGDTYAVEVRRAIPAEQRSEYREFEPEVR
jgi:hypothetical protein